MLDIKTIADRADMIVITQFIKENYQDMYITWANYSTNGYYEK